MSSKKYVVYNMTRQGGLRIALNVACFERRSGCGVIPGLEKKQAHRNPVKPTRLTGFQ